MSLSKVRRLNAAVAICRCFLYRRCRLIIVYNFDFKEFTIFLNLKENNTTKFKSWFGHGRTNRRTGSAGPVQCKGMQTKQKQTVKKNMHLVYELWFGDLVPFNRTP